MEELITIEVDGVELPARKGQMLIEVTDAADVYVPRFCYHKKLSVAANCRMCLVEVEKAPKPVPACATPVMPGMKVKTRSPKALDAQKGTMEFLLINHPLDCPICDQGGECELQDLAMGYGSSVSRYTEGKRVVQDKDIGPLIRTDMTRCIHCTRCVRFGEEIAGMRELGATGRGEFMQIGTYVASTVTSELSGNVIDVCPVGALTSKPYRYSARAWELRAYPSLSPHDAVGSNLWVHAKGSQVKRVLPRENEAVNEVWIADRDRYSYEGLRAPDRLTTALVRGPEGWREADISRAIEQAARGLAGIAGERLGVLAQATATTEEAFLLAEVANALQSPHRDYRLRQTQTNVGALQPGLGMSFESVEGVRAALLIGCNLRHEAPMLNHRLRKAALSGASVSIMSAMATSLNWPVAERLTLSPEGQLAALKEIVKAWCDLAETPASAVAQLQGVVPSATAITVARQLFHAPEPLILFGAEATASAVFADMLAVLEGLQGLSVRVAWLPLGPNAAGVQAAGLVPGPAGLAAHGQLQQGLDAWLLFNCEPELDGLLGATALATLKQAKFNVVVTPYATPAMRDYAHILLPSAIFAENEGHYRNAEGRDQAFAQAVKPPGEARPGWRLLRALGAQLAPERFPYDTLSELSPAALAQQATAAASVTPTRIATPANATVWVPSVAMYRTDALVRRAPALQASIHAGEANLLHLAERTAARLGCSDGDEVELLAHGKPCGHWTIRIDANVAPEVVTGDSSFGQCLPESGAAVTLKVLAQAAKAVPA